MNRGRGWIFSMQTQGGDVPMTSAEWPSGWLLGSESNGSCGSWWLLESESNDSDSNRSQSVRDDKPELPSSMGIRSREPIPLLTS